jgi:hypothetical protein
MKIKVKVNNKTNTCQKRMSANTSEQDLYFGVKTELEEKVPIHICQKENFQPLVAPRLLVCSVLLGVLFVLAMKKSVKTNMEYEKKIEEEKEEEER